MSEILLKKVFLFNLLRGVGSMLLFVGKNWARHIRCIYDDNEIFFYKLSELNVSTRKTEETGAEHSIMRVYKNAPDMACPYFFHEK